MPSRNQSGTQHRESFPVLQEQIGEDPGRYLDCDLVGPDVDDGRVMLVRARIRGIDSIETVRAWIAVERRLGHGPADGPREGIIRLLDQREERLEDIRERPDRLPHGPRRPCECCDENEDTLSASEARERRSEDRARRTAGYSSSSPDLTETSSQSERSTLSQFSPDDVDEDTEDQSDSETDTAVAMDGGEDQ